MSTEAPFLNRSLDLTSPKKKLLDVSLSNKYIPKPHVMISSDTFKPLIPSSTRNLDSSNFRTISLKHNQGGGAVPQAACIQQHDHK